jgi:hypothetical protein
MRHDDRSCLPHSSLGLRRLTAENYLVHTDADGTSRLSTPRLLPRTSRYD